MTIMQKVLDALEKDKSLIASEIFAKIELTDEKPLSKIDKSNLMNCLFKLYKLKIVAKDGMHGSYAYTLIKDKYICKPRAFKPIEQRRIETKPRPFKPKKKVFKPLEWYALKTQGHIEQIAKEFKIPIPKTRNEIESFYHTVKSQTI